MATMTYTWEKIDRDDLTATDLYEEAEAATALLQYAIAGRVVVYRNDRPEPEMAELIFIPSEARIGVAWGGDAAWGDATSVEQGLDRWIAGELVN